ncbi:MAG: hypothetical protein L3J02_04700 [Henriciella sp.]|nr:hypothetical protein [Henriciella sp.]
MFRGLLVLFSACLVAASPFPARAEPACLQSELACILEAAWSAALVLPDEKQARIKPLIVAMAARAGDPDLIQFWVEKLSEHPVTNTQLESEYPDFGWNYAQKVLEPYGVDGLIKFAREKREPLHYGRSDILLAAGKRLLQEEPEQAKRLNTALFDLIGSASDFEKPELANAAAELAMYRCDVERFDRATALTLAPNNLRYAFWRARMTGDGGALADRIRAEADEEDTRHVRQVLDGYRAIVELGYCD